MALQKDILQQSTQTTYIRVPNIHVQEHGRRPQDEFEQMCIKYLGEIYGRRLAKIAALHVGPNGIPDEVFENYLKCRTELGVHPATIIADAHHEIRDTYRKQKRPDLLQYCKLDSPIATTDRLAPNTNLRNTQQVTPPSLLESDNNHSAPTTVFDSSNITDQTPISTTSAQPIEMPSIPEEYTQAYTDAANITAGKLVIE